MIIFCPACNQLGGNIDKGRAMDGRRAYRCRLCGKTWSMGTNGRAARYSPQRQDYQFKDTGATRRTSRRRDGDH